MLARLFRSAPCALATLLGAPHALAQRGNPVVQFEGRSIDQMIGEFMTANAVPGMTLAIVQAPYITRVTGYGVCDPATRRLASPNTLYDIGPLVRAYVAVAVMQLVESGAIGVDDRLDKRLADVALPAAWRPVTIRQLLGHASGIPDYRAQPEFNPAAPMPPQRLFALVGREPLAFSPGSAVAECATDFYLLALVVERAGGKPFERFVEEGQLRRLELAHTSFAGALSQVRQETLSPEHPTHSGFLAARPLIDPTEIAIGHSAEGHPILPSKRDDWSAFLGWGALYASAGDISLWDIGLAGSLLLANKESRELVYSGFRLSDGSVAPSNAGWHFLDRKGLMEIRGGGPGFSVYLSRFTDKGDLVCVTLCANREALDLADLARRIAGALDPRLGPSR